ncbi:hypothetical protein BKA70DRAFT_1222270 [Coprinopsis sp. MPI-PUGE-AT-0042]|nr:hypothetical protein BKA70DRAFT_1222270 [Coprinopsis sp. MPI-PUGE-AT-0042]
MKALDANLAIRNEKELVPAVVAELGAVVPELRTAIVKKETTVTTRELEEVCTFIIEKSVDGGGCDEARVEVRVFSQPVPARHGYNFSFARNSNTSRCLLKAQKMSSPAFTKRQGTRTVKAPDPEITNPVSLSMLINALIPLQSPKDTILEGWLLHIRGLFLSGFLFSGHWDRNRRGEKEHSLVSGVFDGIKFP